MASASLPVPSGELSSAIKMSTWGVAARVRAMIRSMFSDSLYVGMMTRVLSRLAGAGSLTCSLSPLPASRHWRVGRLALLGDVGYILAQPHSGSRPHGLCRCGNAEE